VHRAGADLDLVVEWCEPGVGVTALDVATGGGHVARRLRERHCLVTTCDAAAGMEPDVVCAAEELPFRDRAFDVVVCRLAAHHFDDPAAAVAEMARVCRKRVVIEDGLHNDERVEEAERLRDSTHVRAYTKAEWLAMLSASGLEVVDTALHPRRHVFTEWLGCTGCEGETASRVRGLLAHVTEPGGEAWLDAKFIVKAVRRF
jgi:SAM-dependent methyltransferase